MFYFVSDIHGHIRLDNLKKNIQKICLNSEDFLIILGDAGIVWSEQKNKEVYEFYNNLPCMVLFIDGNHENFSLLNQYPKSSWNGGTIRLITSNIIYLMRGEIFKINNIKFFTFGGGFSAKRLSNTSPVFIWDEELPCEDEYQNAWKNIEKHKNTVDYILTHSAPSKVLEHLNLPRYSEEEKLINFLDKINQTLSFKQWFLGHYHIDASFDEYFILFNDYYKIER